MDLYLWAPATTPIGSILVIQEIFGVGAYIRAVAQRLADAGYLVGAPDVFWRFSPHWAAGHDQAGLEQSLAKVGQLDPAQAITDCVDALHHLHRISGLETHPAVLGFCLGGTLAWGVAISDKPSACVAYYGSGVPDMMRSIDAVRCPTLFHFGDDDPYIPNEGVDRICAAIAGRKGFVVNVEQAGHAFDNHEAKDLFYVASAAQAAWAKTMAFLGRHVAA